jgi:hypothetical protein
MGDEDRQERMQRIRVGLTGIAVVLLIIMLATVVLTRINLAAGPGNNVAQHNGTDEPLTDVGVVPGASENRAVGNEVAGNSAVGSGAGLNESGGNQN